MKTIAIFSAYILPHLGGIERYIDNLSKQLVKKSINTIIVTTNYNDESDFEERDNIKIFRIPIFNSFKNRYPIPKYNKEQRDIISKLNAYQIDAIIVNTRFHLTSHIGADYGKKNNIPVYLIEHGSNYVTLDNKFIDFFANRYEDFLTWKIKRKIKGFYGVSKACSVWLKHFNINSSGIWYNSIDCSQSVPSRKFHKKINFLYAGRLIKQKGVKNILDAFTNLEKKYSNIHLYIAGDGPELEDYKSIYNSANIEFLGKLDYQHLLKYYAKTDVFLYPPLWPEGLPTSILEAGLMKCMVIGTSQGGIKEIISNNKNGIIVKENSKDLYRAMEKTLNNPLLMKKYSKQLNLTIKTKFNWETTTEKIIKDMGINTKV
ncbi:MAG: glycosyltransferase family 4 protein [Bacilli bacterium]